MYIRESCICYMLPSAVPLLLAACAQAARGSACMFRSPGAALKVASLKLSTASLQLVAHVRVHAIAGQPSSSAHTSANEFSCKQLKHTAQHSHAENVQTSSEHASALQ